MIVLLTIQYIIEFTKLYIVILYIVKLTELRNIARLNLITILTLAVIDICRLIYYGSIIEQSYDIYICGLLAIFVMFLGYRIWKKLLLLFGIYIVICFIDMLMVGFIVDCFSISIAVVLGNPIYKLILNSANIVLYVIISYIVKILNVNFRLEFMSKKEIYLLIIGVLGCGFYITPFQLYANNADKSPLERLFILGISITGFIILAVVVILIIKNNDLKYLKKQQKLQDRILFAQQLYYSSRLQQEQETRKFRHDINEHLYCISFLLKTSRYEELRVYVEGVMDTLIEIKDKTEIQTGSELINIILSDLMNQYLTQNIVLSWYGFIPDTQIENIDLCGLFSNLLKNAFEAAVQCSNKTIDITTTQYDNAFFIKIVNACQNNVEIIGDRLITSKTDTINHGYGSQIIRDIINKYKGQIKYLFKNNLFTVEITILNICK